MKSLLILFVTVFLLNIVTYGQIFQENIIIDYTFNTEEPKSVYSADLDGDGDMDMVSASFGDNYICWFENIDGEGTFSSARSISENALGATWVVAFDLDGDGDIDILSTSVLDDKIAWYENLDGNGDFSSEKIISNNMEIVTCAYASDLDGDGDLDVVATSILDDKVSWFRNDGNADFGPEIIISNNIDGARTLYTADMDGDGDEDVIYGARDDNEIGWFQNDGLGNFSDKIIISTNALGVESIFVSDIDNDGDFDVISASRLDAKVAWYENDGLGNFGQQLVLTTDATESMSVYAADVDGDGDKDIIYAAGFWQHIKWFENTDGQGTFGSPQSIVATTGGAFSVFAADIDNDGDADILSAEQSYDIIWYDNTDGLGSFVEGQNLTRSADRVKSVFSADLDGDGDLDVISASEEDNKIAWYENIGNGNFGIQQVISTSVQFASSVYASDIDGDNDIDIVFASDGQNTIAWFENTNGQGDFSVEHTINTEALNAKQVICADLDGDGDDDVISASSSDDKIAWYENNGSGVFGAAIDITTIADGCYSVFAADIDGDGDYDILGASIWDNKVAWYENTNGQGDFGPQQIISTNANGASHVYAADLDGDGDVDVISSSLNDNKIAWYENLNGMGFFSTEHLLSLNADFARCVTAGDIDNDGDLDIVSASSSDNKIAWYENLDGLGGFSSQLIISDQADDAAFVHFSDINGDGRGNVLSASIEDDKIAWYQDSELVHVVDGPKSLSLNVYPNPTNDYIKVNTNEDIRRIEIFTNQGALVLRNDFQKVINISKLEKGIYFCVITYSNNKQITSKIIRN